MTNRIETAWTVAFALACASTPGSAQEAGALPLADTREITVVEQWVGLSAVSPVQATYTLRRAADGSFAGTAKLRVASGLLRRDTTFATVLPAPAADTLLTALARVPVRKDRYSPRFDHTDDDPAITALFRTSAGEVRFHTESQGDGYAPWQVVVNGVTAHVSDTDAVWRALVPALDLVGRRVYEAMIAAAEADPEARCAGTHPIENDDPPTPRPAHARGAPWYERSEAIVIGGRRYVKYAGPRDVLREDLEPVGEYRGIPAYAEPASRPGAPRTEGAPGVVYIPIGPSCWMQPYQLTPRK